MDVQPARVSILYWRCYDPATGAFLLSLYEFQFSIGDAVPVAGFVDETRVNLLFQFSIGDAEKIESKAFRKAVFQFSIGDAG